MQAHRPSSSLPRPRFVLLTAVAVLLAAALAHAQGPQAPPHAKTAAAKPAQRAADTRPAWAELTPGQQAALKPLAAQWNTLSEAQKRKWIALSSNYGSMKPEEQAKLHSRMNEWVALSPQQRSQARLNFAEAKTLSPDDRKAKWEAYQALPPEEKRRLAGTQQPKAPSTAVAVKPVPAQKLANVPKSDHHGKGTPRIAAGPQAESTLAVPPPAAAPIQSN